MPQASEALRARWHSDAAALEHLDSRGYVLRSDFTWRLPRGKTLADVSAADEMAIRYLIDEWDYGQLVVGCDEAGPKVRATMRDVTLTLASVVFAAAVLFGLATLLKWMVS